MDNYKKVAEVLATSPKTVVKVACLKEDPNIIIGYSILSSDFQGIHFVYVKNVWRKRGVGKSLVPQHPSYVTHLTKLGQSLLTKFDGVVFNPFKQ